MTRPSARLFVSVVFSAVTISLLANAPQASADQAAYRFDPVAVTDESAPGTGGSIFRALWFEDLDESGIVSLAGFLETSGPDDEGLWYGTPGNIALAVREGDPIAGFAGLTYY